MPERTVLTDDVLTSTLEKINKVKEALEDVLAGASMTEACTSRGLNTGQVRNLIKSKAISGLNKDIESIEEYMKPNPYERIYGAVFGCKPENCVLPLDYKETMQLVLKGLPEFERKIMYMRFGVSGNPMYLSEVGLYFNLDRERIRQIESKVLRRLRRSDTQELLAKGIAKYTYEKNINKKALTEYKIEINDKKQEEHKEVE